MFSQLSPSRLVDWADQQDVSDQPLFHRIAHLVCRILLITAQEFKKNELALRAAALTFTVLLSLVPILAMSTAVVKGLGGSDQLKDVVYSYVGSLGRQNTSEDLDTIEKTGQSTAPLEKTKKASSDLTQHLYSAINRIFDYVDRTNFATLGTIGVAGIVLSVVLVLGNIELAMNAIWHVDKSRSIMRKIADYLALIVLMPFSVNVGLAASTVLKNDALLSKFSIFLPIAWLQALILKFIPVLVLALTLYVIYLFFPNTRVKTVPAMVGALFAGFCWFEVQNIYINMQIGVAKYNAIYGSFATLPLFLVWIYCGWIFILIGAQIAYDYQHNNYFRLTTAVSPPSLQLAVAYDLLDYVQDQFDKEQKATLEHFTSIYTMHNPHLVSDTIDQLKGAELIHTTEDSTSLKPSIPRESLDYGKVVRAVIGATFSETEGGKKSSHVLGAVAAPLTTPLTELTSEAHPRQ